MRLTRVFLLLCAGGLLAGCGAVVRSSKLSDRPEENGRTVYLSSGGAPKRYRTLGFAQLTGIGVNVAGVSDVGDNGLDSAIRGKLADEARRMGGDGVIHIEFFDENPPTDYERVGAASRSIQNVASGSGGPETQNRSVVVTGEVIQFLE